MHGLAIQVERGNNFAMQRKGQQQYKMSESFCLIPFPFSLSLSLSCQLVSVQMLERVVGSRRKYDKLSRTKLEGLR